MNISISNLNIQRQVRLKAELKKQIKALIVKEQKRIGEISIIFTNNSTILDINREFLNHSYYTDVITFSRCQKDVIAGDIYISLDQIKINSEKYGTLYKDELLRVIIHGILHLVGYNDKTDGEKITMRKMEDIYLCGFNVNNLMVE